MSSLVLHSCLAPQIHRFIRLRQLSGTDYHSQAQLLGYFDRFLVEQGVNEPRMTAPITDRYLETLSHLTPRVQYNRFSVVRQLCQYLSRTDPLAYVPEPLKTLSPQVAHLPYIYPPSEISALLAAASELPPTGSLRPHTYRTLLGLLYSTGVRIGEALALNLEHFHRAESCLYIAQGKFRKARWVPLSASTARALQHYVDRRRRTPPRSPDAPLLLNQRSRRLHPGTVNHTFRQLLRHCGIPHPPHTGPRIHD
jgi:site-specific recombinase XerD